MSCYLRHIKDVFDAADVVLTKENKKEIDRIIHELVDVAFKNCPLTGKAVKAHIQGDEKARHRFIEKLKNATAG